MISTSTQIQFNLLLLGRKSTAASLSKTVCVTLETAHGYYDDYGCTNLTQQINMRADNDPVKWIGSWPDVADLH